MRRLRVLIAMVVLFVDSLQVSGEALSVSTNSMVKLRIKELTQLIKQQPGNAQAYADRAAAKMELRDVYSAIKDYSVALAISSASNTDHVEARVGRGNAFLGLGAFKEALKDFETVLAKGSTTEALYGRAVARYYLDDYFGAIRDLDEVVSTDPGHEKALCNRGIVRLELNQLEEAVADLTLFLTHHPEHPEAAYSLSVATNRLQKRIAKRGM